MKIVSPEYGLILARIKINRWEIVLFHRSYTTLFDMSLATADLCTIFKEGQYQYVRVIVNVDRNMINDVFRTHQL